MNCKLTGLAFSLVCLIAIFFIPFTGANNGQKLDVYHDYDDLTFPYIATEQRRKQIIDNSGKLQLGFDEAQVKALLGKPDFIAPLYNRVKGGEVIGTSYFYVISQDKKEGSANDKNIHSITIRFDKENKLFKAHGSRLSFFKDIR